MISGNVAGVMGCSEGEMVDGVGFEDFERWMLFPLGPGKARLGICKGLLEVFNAHQGADPSPP